MCRGFYGVSMKVSWLQKLDLINSKKMLILEHKYLIPLEITAKLWRYVNFKKFRSMLENKSLFFCRADKFGDPFECSTPRREFEYRKQKELTKNGNDVSKADHQVKEMSDFFKQVKKSIIVNCWHINTHESAGMWQLYLKNNEGVAIQSDISRLSKAFLNTPESIYASKVRYIDYEKDIWYNQSDYPFHTVNTITPVIHKRIEFKHETEFRLFIEIHESTFDSHSSYWEKRQFKSGKNISVDINSLVEKIIFSPTIDKNGKKRILDMGKVFGYNFEFTDSSLLNEPKY